ncbi:hypothetical protein HMN09_00913600 [Mycena chlorophos]|uniref:Uncharacterized protein n=1 Tax=Mycena chlorophos TaxID=658473 RepID=A0A8H6SJ41_MYCCL|nr:hypothetical protein HMN09_00913600 [Mycena chlorophos]
MLDLRLVLLLAIAGIGVGSAKQHKPKPDWYTRNRNTVQAIYNLTVYPNNLVIFSGDIPPGLFNENATGRIDPVGDFFGFQDSVEYFFGLAPTPTGQAPNGVFSSADVVEFVSGCPQVAASTVYFTDRTLNADNTTGELVSMLKQVAFWHFDDDGAVLDYDAWIPNIPKQVNLTQPGFFTPQGMNITLNTLCAAQASTCVGANQVYTSPEQCYEILSQRDFGDWDEVWGDNVICRTLHVRLALIRPEVHCPHVGPTGGGKCVYADYVQAYFSNDTQVFGPSGPGTFTCDTYED